MSTQETNYKQGYSKSTLSSHASRTVQSDAAFLVPYIKPTDKILDIGCGPGTITAGLAKLVPSGSVVGVDLSDEVLTAARTHLSELRASGALANAGELSFQPGDVLKGLPFPDASFDVVYCSQLFPHLPLPDLPVQAASEMRRLLRPGGLLASRDVTEIHWYPRRLGLDRIHVPKMIRGMGVPELVGAEMPAVLRRAGFDVDGKGETGRRAKVGAGTTVYSDPEARRFLADGLLGRLAQGDTFRQSWTRAGISEEEIEETRRALKEWVDTEDAWYVCVQAEVLAWK